MAKQQLTLNDVVGYLRTRKKIAFVLGAGASKAAGIPLAPELITDIKKTYSHCLVSLSEEEQKDYGKVMDVLDPTDRWEFIQKCLADSHPTWGYLAFASILMMFNECEKTSHCRVLSFNFDLLVEQSLAMLGHYLPVYDFGVASTANVSRLAPTSLIHLHGQSYGFKLLNSKDETTEQAEVLRPLFTETLHEHATIVIGYSGESDAAFDMMSEAFDSRSRLLWLGFDKAPAEHLKPLLAKKYAHYIGGCDFDQTMIELAEKLGCWPPKLIQNPPRHVLGILETLPPSHLEAKEDVLSTIKDHLAEEDKAWEKRAVEQDLRVYLLLIMAEQNVRKAQTLTGDERKEAFQESFQKFTEALSISPDNLRCLNNWGNALSDYAKGLSGEERAAAFQDSFQKYEQALRMKPDMHEALNNWGLALSDYAEGLSGEERETAFQDSFQKYKQALKSKPDMHEALYNWGNALFNYAKGLSGEERAAALQDSFQKYEQALKIKPDKHEALYNWGNALFNYAQDLSGKERAAAFQDSFQKYEQALKSKPDKHEALYNWGNALFNYAQDLSGKERAAAFQDSFQKYEQALKIKPDKHEALYNLGAALSDYAKGLSGEERERAFEQAEEKLRQAEALAGKPSYNLACLFALRGQGDAALDQLEACGRAGTLPSADHLQQDEDLASLRDSPRFQALLREPGEAP